MRLTNNTKTKSITKILKDIEIGTTEYHCLFAKGTAAALFPERFPSGSPLFSLTIRSYHRAGHLLSSSSSLSSFSSSSYFHHHFRPRHYHCHHIIGPATCYHRRHHLYHFSHPHVFHRRFRLHHHHHACKPYIF